MSRGLAQLSACLLLSAVAAACGRSSGPNEGSHLRPPGRLEVSESLPVGHKACFYGGTMLRSGFDADRDGQLSVAETSDVELFCDADPFATPFGGPDGTPGEGRVEAKGGPGGQAGPGGVFSAAMDHNSAGHYAILSTGEADTSFSFPEPDTALAEIQAEHLIAPTELDFLVTAGTVLSVPVLAITPETLAPGELVANLSGTLFASDEVQGVRVIESLGIGPGATLLLDPQTPVEPGAEPVLRIRLSGVLVNEGSLYVAPSPVLLALDIEAESYFGAPDAAVLGTAGAGDSGLEGPGRTVRFVLADRFDNQGLVDTSGSGSRSAAGSLSVQAAELVSSGTLRARGGDAGPNQDAGAGGHVELHASGSIVNLGLVDASGGSLGRNGGGGGAVTFEADTGHVWNAAAIHLSGGSGTDSGGPGGDLTVLAEGDVRNGSDVSANGGEGGIEAGAAGQILLSTRGQEPNGSVESAGRLSATAGAGSAEGQAQKGGLVVILADESLRHEGDIRVDGSTAGQGGNGGMIQLSADTMDIHASGVFSARGGGAFTSRGGAGGQILIDARAVAIRGAVELGGGQSIASPAGPGGSLRVDATDGIDLSFSEADLSGGTSRSAGGQGGRLELTAGGSIQCEGSIDLSGGSGLTGGRGGRSQPSIIGLGIFRNACAIGANGGNGATGPGGQGGILAFTVAAELHSSAALSASGGGSIEGDAGDAGEVTFITNGTSEAPVLFEISGDVIANGGPALSKSARGGAGGLIEIPSFNDDNRGFEVRLVGYERIDLSGGAGGSSGGAGGVFDINNGLYDQDPPEDVTSGERGIVSYVHIFANGGEATAGTGGDGGILLLRTAPLGSGPEPHTALYNYGNWELLGGKGETEGGQGGAFLVNTAEGIFFLGNILASGGDAAGRGGDGSTKADLATRGALVFNGSVESRGGHGLVGDAPAGVGGTLALSSLELLEVAEGADLSGGDNVAGLREGGSGGTLIIFAPNPENIAMGRPVDLGGGGGLSEGPAGKYHLNDLSILIPDDAVSTQQIN